MKTDITASFSPNFKVSLFLSRLIVILAVITAAFGLHVSIANAATFTVNSTDDSADGSCDHPYVDSSTDCTLTEAINTADTTAGADIINFDISTDNFPDDGDGQFTISIVSQLNTIDEEVEITAASMWDVDDDRPGVLISGGGNGFSAFRLQADNIELKGLKIDDFDSDGVLVRNSNITIGTDCDGTLDARERNVITNIGDDAVVLASVDNTVIAGNYIGIDEDGDTVAGAASDGVHIDSLSTNTVVGYSSASCSAAAQRNVLSGNTHDGVNIEGDNTTVFGNYLGTDATGMLDRGNGFHGADLKSDANLNWIGTNGDGVNDDKEGNVISGNDSHGIFSFELEANDGAGGPDENRLSGNTIGLSVDWSTAVPNGIQQVNLRSDDNIIGWCDTSISGTLCSDAGSLEDQRNVIWPADTYDGIRLGVRADDTEIYGNYIGTIPGGTVLTHTGGNGIGFNMRVDGTVVGGSDENQANVISGFDYGVFAIQQGATKASPAENVVIDNNTFDNNTVGMGCVETLEYAAATPYEFTITNNTISDSDTYGIHVQGCAWNIENNVIDGSGDWGVFIEAIERPDDPPATGSVYDNPYDSMSPNNASEDLVSISNLTGNTVSNNTGGGVYIVDTHLTNDTTVFDDNTFTDNSNLNLQQDWYAAVELVDYDNTIQTSGSYTVTLNPNEGSCINSCTGSTVADAGGGDAIWAPSGVDYDDATTWFTVTERIVQTDGTEQNFSPYTVTVAGDLESHTGTNYTVNGVDDDTASAVGLPNGIDTDGVFRYQVIEVPVSTVPAAPSLTSPSNATTGLSTTPTLVAGTFSDAEQSHVSSFFNVYSSSALCTTGGVGDAYSYTTSGADTSHTLTSALDNETTYYWSVAYTNDFGNRSEASACNSFTTIRTIPEFIGTLPDVEWNEDETVESWLDLDTYFSDEEGETLSFTASIGEEDVEFSVGAGAVVKWFSSQDWNGSTTAAITACDTDAECISSNTFDITVAAVNDAPGVPTSGFSPANGDRSADTQPTIVWNAVIDVDDNSDDLTYELRLGTSPDPENTFTYTLNSSAGSPSVTLNSVLDDETEYYYVVRSVDPSGDSSEWSTVQQFEVNEELIPVITLTKEVAVVNQETVWLNRLNSIVQVAAVFPVPLPVYGDTSGASVLESLEALTDTLGWVAVMVAIISAVGFLLIAGSIRNLKAAVLSNTSTAFIKIHQFDGSGAEKRVSFNKFKRQLHINRAILSISLLLIVVSGVVQANQQSVLEPALRSITSTFTTQPGQFVDVTLRYDNSGDGSATAAVLSDSLPAGTVLVDGSLTYNGEGASSESTQMVQLGLGTIADESDSSNRSGTVSYRLAVTNPLAADTVVFPEAMLSANELSTAALSSSLEVGVVSADVTGTVSGLPVNSGIGVQVWQADVLLTTVATDDSGEYIIEGLGDGTYTLVLDAPSGYEADDRIIEVLAGNLYQFEDFVAQEQTAVVPENPVDTPTEIPADEGESTDQEEGTNDELDDESEPEEQPEDTNAADNSEAILIDVPAELREDFTEVELGTAEEVAEKTDLATQLQQFTRIVTPAAAQQTDEPVISAITSDIIAAFFGEPASVTVSGITVPDARVTVSICFTTLQTTTTDAAGQWVMTIPPEVVPEGEHSVYATVEKDGVKSEAVVVGTISNTANRGLSRTAIVGSLSITILLFVLHGLLMILVIRRENAKTLHDVAITVLVTDMIALGVLILSFFLAYMRAYNVDATGLPQTSITLDAINGHTVSEELNYSAADVDTVQFGGTAPAGSDIVLTLCQDKPFREVVVSELGTWATSVSVTDLPETNFQVSAQAKAGPAYGSVHPLVDMTVAGESPLVLRSTMFVLHYVLLLIGSVLLWRTYRKDHRESGTLDTEGTDPSLH